MDIYDNAILMHKFEIQKNNNKVSRHYFNEKIPIVDGLNEGVIFFHTEKKSLIIKTRKRQPWRLS